MQLTILKIKLSLIKFNTNLKEKKALENLVLKHKKIDRSLTPEEIQTHVYTTGKENVSKTGIGLNLLRSCFWQENGPRMGFFKFFDNEQLN